MLRRLTHPDPADAAYGPLSVVVAPVRAVMQPLAKGLGELVPVALKPGDERPLEDVVEALAAAAYSRTDLVERRGEFAVRGGILDVFPPTEEHPLRVEFWGDTVEEVRWFKVADQRSLELAQHGLWAPPCRELLLTDAVRERARRLAAELPGVGDMLAKVAEGIAVEGMESLAPALLHDAGETGGMESVLDLLPRGRSSCSSTPSASAPGPTTSSRRAREFLEASWVGAAAGSAVPVDLQSLLGTASFWTLAQVREHARSIDLPWWSLTGFAQRPGAGRPRRTRTPGDDGVELVNLGTTDVEPFRGDTEAAVASCAPGWPTGGGSSSSPTVRVWPGACTRCWASTTWPRTLDPLTDDIATGLVHVTTGSLGRGFVDAAQRLAVVTETDLTGQPGSTGTKDMRRMPSRRRNQVDPLQLRPGDYVVHEQHGVGRFVEMVQRTVGGATREYLVLEYAPSQARAAGRPALRAHRPARPGDQVRRRRGAVPQQARRLRLAQDQGARRAATSSRSPPTSSGSTAPGWPPSATPSGRTPPGSASSRTPSPTSRRPTSSPRSTRSRPTWRSRSPWTG